MIILETKALHKHYGSGETEVRALDGVDLTVEKGEFAAVVGTSGSGKSTLLHMLGGLDRPTSGSVTVDGKDIFSLKDEALTIFRRRKIGFVFQNYNLVPVLSVYENIVLPIQLDGQKPDAAYVDQIIETLGLEKKLRNLPNNLSGGQQQRVAIARALASDPSIILCDEATSALDPEATRSVLDLLKELNRTLGVTIVVITHEMKVVELVCDKVAVMASGEIKEVGTVHDVFLHPQSATARRLIEPAVDALEAREGQVPAGMLRIAFTGEESGDPVISDLSITCGVRVSIMGANTQDIGGHAYGQILIQMPQDPDACARIRAYLDGRGIHYEESGDPRMPGGDNPQQAGGDEA